MKKPRIAVLASGSGTTFEFLVKKSASNELNAEVSKLIVDRQSIGAFERAKSLGVSVEEVNPKKFESSEAWALNLVEAVKSVEPDLIVLAGYLKKLPLEFIREFEGKIINTHPALLPKFGGKGMYGSNVHRAVIEAGESISGVTVHYVNENFDEGPIVAQKKIELLANETAESLEERINEMEKPFLLLAIKKILNA